MEIYMENIKNTELFDLTKTMASDYLSSFTYPFEALKGISNLIVELGEDLDTEKYEKRGENIWVVGKNSSYSLHRWTLHHR